MLLFIFQIIWFYLPAAISNSCGTLFRKINFLNIPVDLNQKINGRSIFGKNKTYRGFFFGILFAILISYLQKILYPYCPHIYLFNYSQINPFILGFLLGFGAPFGDLIESLVKRRLNKKPGQPFIPFDQIDWIIGANIFLLFYIFPTWQMLLISFLFFGLIHPLSNIIAYYLKIKDTKY